VLPIARYENMSKNWEFAKRVIQQGRPERAKAEKIRKNLAYAPASNRGGKGESKAHMKKKRGKSSGRKKKDSLLR